MPALDFEATLNTSSFDRSLDKVIKEIGELSNKAKTQGVGLDEILNIKNIDQFADGLIGLSEKQKQAFERIIQSAKKTKEALENTTDPTQIGVYNYELKKAEKSLNELIKTGTSGKVMDDLINPKNIRIQEQEVKKLTLQLENLKKEAKTPKGVGIDTRVLKSAEKDLMQAKVALSQMKKELGENDVKLRSIATRMRPLLNEMRHLSEQGLENSERYKQIRSELERLLALRETTNSQIRGENLNLKALSETINLASGAVSTYMGVTSLFIKNQERLQEVQAKLQSVIAVSVGVQQLQQGLSRTGIIIDRVRVVQAMALAKAEELKEKNTIRATIAQRAFNLVAKANPYVLLASAIVSVAGALYIFSKSVGDATAEQRKLNEEVGKKFVDSYSDSLTGFRRLQESYKLVGDSIEEQIKWIKENKDALRQQNLNINDVNKANEIFVSKSDEVLNAIKLRAMAEAKASVAHDIYKQTITSQLDFKRQEEDLKGNNGAWRKWWAGLANGWSKTWRDITGQNEKGFETLQKQWRGDKLIRESEEMMKKFNEIWTDFGLNDEDSDDEPLDKLFPKGSVAEIEQRLNKIRTKLNEIGESSSQEVVDALKKQYNNVLIELETAQKRVQIKSLKDTLNEMQGLWNDYYDAVDKIGKQKADEIYKDVLPKNTSQLSQLQKIKEQLELKGITDKEDAENLKIINEEINRLLGNKSVLDKFKSDFENLIDGKSQIEQLDLIQKKLNEMSDAERSSGQGAFLIGKKEDIQKDLQEQIDAILKQQESFEQKRINIQTKYASLRIQAAKKGSQEEIEAINKAEQQALNDLSMNMLMNSKEFVQVFTDLAVATDNAMKQVRRKLIEQLKKAKTEEERIKIGEFIEKIDDEYNKRHPFETMANAIKILADKSKDAEERMKALLDLGKAMQNVANTVISIMNSANSIAEDLGISLDNEFGDALDKIGEFVQGISEAGQGLKDIASGDVIGGSMKVISGVVHSISSLFNNDKKRERQIKEMERQIGRLALAYNKLEHAIQGALGTDMYTARNQQIENLRQQQELLRQMAEKERAKKKSDQSRIDEYLNQIEQIDMAIEDLINNIAEDILQTSVQGLADELSSALVDAFLQGEDAAKAMDKVIDDMFKNMIKHALALKIQTPLNNYIDQLLREAGFNPDTGEGDIDIGSISQEAYENFKDNVQGLMGEFEQLQDLFDGIFGGTIGADDTIQGQIKNITSQEANELVAQLNAVRINQGVAGNIATDSLQELKGISVTLNNIENYVFNLVAIRQQITDLNQKTGNQNMIRYSESLNS